MNDCTCIPVDLQTFYKLLHVPICKRNNILEKTVHLYLWTYISKRMNTLCSINFFTWWYCYRYLHIPSMCLRWRSCWSGTYFQCSYRSPVVERESDFTIFVRSHKLSASGFVNFLIIETVQSVIFTTKHRDSS